MGVHMLKLASLTASLLLSVSIAQAENWQKEDHIGKGFAQYWVKKEPRQHCVVGVDLKTGQVIGQVYRGTILEKNLDGKWHLADYHNVSIAAVKVQGFKLLNMYGTMIAGMEM